MITTKSKKNYSMGRTQVGEPFEGPVSQARPRLILLKHGWLAEQDAGFQEAVFEKVVLKRFSAGDHIGRRGDTGGGMFGISRGVVGVYVQLKSEQERLAHIIHDGSWFGYGPALMRRGRTLSFRAISECQLLYLDLVAVDQLMAADPRWIRNLARVSEYGMDVAISNIGDLLIPNVEQRIAATLLRIAPPQDSSSSQPSNIVGLTQAQLGEMSNAARDVVNRTLKHFEEKGWIEVSYKKISIINRSQLNALVSN